MQLMQPYVQVWENPNGNVTISSASPLCLSFMVLPGMNTWSPSLFSFLMLLGLCYCFLGIAIIADLFMAAIEMITSRTVEVTVIRPGVGKVTEEVLTWNPTIANLTLMALGSSAPEILLAVIGTVKDLGTDNVDE
jgi:solute carrier family 8 (sodium/calcium exchanger)